MRSDLQNRKCVPCEGGVDPLTLEEIQLYMQSISGWTLSDDVKKISREYEFLDFTGALTFVNKVGEIAEKEGHHPDILLHNWNKVQIILYTHAINGLHMNDFVIAVKINELLKTL